MQVSADAMSTSSNPVTVIEQQYGHHLPQWLVSPLTLLLLLIAVVTMLKPLAPMLRVCGSFLRRGIHRPDADERHLFKQRRIFARYVRSQLDMANSREDWREERFADLEAEVEMQGRVRVWKWTRFSPTRKAGARRERSLSAALERSDEEFIVLEGEPGSGKSVALRHLAYAVAARADSARPGVIPLYVNLRGFRPPSRPVASEHVRAYVLETLMAVNDRDVAAFLDQEYQKGLNQGRWLLLLDSFDEIPDVLSATDSNDTVREYAAAIYSFAYAMKQCRVVLASREFRGPNLPIPHFKVMPLRPRQQRALVRNSGIHPRSQDAVLAAVLADEADWSRLAANPMFLGMLCAFVADTGGLPDSAHAVFERYFAARLDADATRITTRFAVSVDQVRHTGELAAYVMAATGRLGLEPERTALIEAILTEEPGDQSLIERALDALEFTKLARVWQPDGSSERTFSFTHRRFQEYFATCHVLRTPDAVDPATLLFDGQWRETAVTMLQTQPANDLAMLLTEAGAWLETMLEEVRDAVLPGSFLWPAGLLHVLGILAAGIHDVPGERAEHVRTLAGQILRHAWAAGHGHDRAWAVEVVLAADSDTTQHLLTRALSHGSTRLQEAAYQSAGRLTELPASLQAGIRRALIALAIDGRLYTEREQARARIARLHPASPAARTFAVLRPVPAMGVTLSVLLPLACALAAPRIWAAALVTAAFGALCEAQNIALILHLRPRLPRWLRFLASRPYMPGRASAGLWAYAVRMIAALALVLMAQALAGQAPEGSGIPMIALFAPSLALMNGAHVIEHGCAGPIRAYMSGGVLGLRHSARPLRPRPRLRDLLRAVLAHMRTLIPHLHMGTPSAWRRSLSLPGARSALQAALMFTAMLMVAVCFQWFGSNGGALLLGYTLTGSLAILVIGLFVSGATQSVRSWRGVRARLRVLRAPRNPFSIEELQGALVAVCSEREMETTLKTIGALPVPPSPAAVRLLADVALLAERRPRTQDKVALHPEMRAWAMLHGAQVEHVTSLVSNEAADEITRLVEAVERQNTFRPCVRRPDACGALPQPR